MPSPDAVRLRHMLDAAEEALAFAAGHARADLDNDRKLVLALIKLVEIVGEAAAKVGAETRLKHTTIPWDAIVATRNRLIHGYSTSTSISFGIRSRSTCLLSLQT